MRSCTTRLLNSLIVPVRVSEVAKQTAAFETTTMQSLSPLGSLAPFQQARKGLNASLSP